MMSRYNNSSGQLTSDYGYKQTEETVNKRSRQNSFAIRVSDIGNRQLEEENVNKRITASDLNVTGVSEVGGVVMSISKIKALIASICKHQDNVSKILLASKETLERRSQIETVFRMYKEAFIEMSTVLTHFMEKNSVANDATENIKSAVREVFNEFKDNVSVNTGLPVTDDVYRKPYASIIASSPKSKVCVSISQEIEVPESISFLVVPDKVSVKNKKYKSSQDAKDAVCRLLTRRGHS